MKRLLGGIAIALMVAAPALADAIYYAPQVTGKRARKNIRHILFVENLTGDMRTVYEQHGYTPHRLRVDGYGVITERWTYYDEGLVFEFNPCGALVHTESISPEPRRAWAFQRDVSGYDEDVPCDD